MDNRTFIFVLWFVSSFVSAETSLKLATLFSDHMVIQRDQPVPVWGWGQVGDEVVVQFGGQKKTGKADDTGKWLVILDPLHASPEGRDLLVQNHSEAQKLKVTDVVVGDVWLCSGQSNMFFRMNKVENSRQEIANANQPNIRFFTVKEQFAQCPATDVNGAWQPASPATVAECSAGPRNFLSVKVFRMDLEDDFKRLFVVGFGC